MRVDGFVFNILKYFLTNRHQRVLVDENFRQFKYVVSGVPQGSISCPLHFILYTTDMWNHLENKIISYADVTTLYVEVTSFSDHINIANSLYRNLFKIQSWCSNVENKI